MRAILLVLFGSVGMMAMVAMPVFGESVVKPMALSAGDTPRGGYAIVPLSSLKGSLASGDPAQLPLLALSAAVDGSKRLPQVELDRSNPTQIVALVTYLGLEDDSVKGIRYRVEMVPSDSLCACQSWKVAWVGRQYTCQAGRGAQDWSDRICR
ncbi:hypothetical protein [Altericista sp. CCNU0014]|uniref:hypothetical protein n=1 Tax=Altericista sp. CCNU0014 TaxID=3082949 RepID=UPI0038509CE2